MKLPKHILELNPDLDEKELAKALAPKGKSNKDKSGLFIYYWNQLVSEVGARQPEAEYHFSESIGRHHKFDWCFVQDKVAVEIDGGQFSPGGGRHNTDEDREKLNIAAMLGYRVFRFSTQMIVRDPHTCIDMVRKALK